MAVDVGLAVAGWLLMLVWFWVLVVEVTIVSGQVILESVEAKEKERVWIKNQTQGDLDDNRLVTTTTQAITT